MGACGRVILRVVFGWEWVAENRAGPGVVHAFEAMFGTQANPLPDLIFGRDEVGEAFADEREAGEGGDVGDGGAF